MRCPRRRRAPRRPRDHGAIKRRTGARRRSLRRGGRPGRMTASSRRSRCSASPPPPKRPAGRTRRRARHRASRSRRGPGAAPRSPGRSAARRRRRDPGADHGHRLVRDDRLGDLGAGLARRRHALAPQLGAAGPSHPAAAVRSPLGRHGQTRRARCGHGRDPPRLPNLRVPRRRPLSIRPRTLAGRPWRGLSSGAFTPTPESRVTSAIEQRLAARGAGAARRASAGGQLHPLHYERQAAVRRRAAAVGRRQGGGCRSPGRRRESGARSGGRAHLRTQTWSRRPEPRAAAISTGSRRCLNSAGSISCTPEFTEHPAVINGASDLMVEVLGEAGQHARFAVGCASLPRNAAVEVEGIFELALSARRPAPTPCRSSWSRASARSRRAPGTPASGPIQPFLRHAFLAALEDSGSASQRTGWLPLHLLVESGGELIGCAPMYLKSHSYGEYVFDWGWASAYERAGGTYYPKLRSRCRSPRCPARACWSGRVGRHGARPAHGLVSAAEQLGVSSLHVTFCREDEWHELGAAGLLKRQGVQYHWHNRGYRIFDDFLASLKHSRRKTIRKERARVTEQGLNIEVLTGDALTPDIWDAFYPFYRSTVDKRWGGAYSVQALLHAPRRDDARAGRANAGASRGPLRRRRAQPDRAGHALRAVWGCRRQFEFLHFEACYYRDRVRDRARPRARRGGRAGAAQAATRLRAGADLQRALDPRPGLSRRGRALPRPGAPEMACEMEELRELLPYRQDNQTRSATVRGSRRRLRDFIGPCIRPSARPRVSEHCWGA